MYKVELRIRMEQLVIRPDITGKQKADGFRIFLFDFDFD